MLDEVKTAEDFEAQVLGAEGAVLVDFSAPWCGPCQRLTPLLEELAGRVDGRARIVQVDVDKASDLAIRYGIMAVPTVLVFRGGEVAVRLPGLRPAGAYLEALGVNGQET